MCYPLAMSLVRPFLCIFALPVLIGMGGCTELPPPGPGMKLLKSSQNEKNANASCYPSCFDLDTSNPALFVLSLKGADAERLYHSLGIKAVQKVKTGSQFTCADTESAYVCIFQLQINDGSVPEILPENQVLLSAPELKVSEHYHSDYFTQDPSPQGSTVTMQVLLDYAKKMNEAMIHVPELSPRENDPYFDANHEYDLNLIKKGVHLICAHQLKKVDPKNLKLDPVPTFACQFTFNTDLGVILKNN